MRFAVRTIFSVRQFGYCFSLNWGLYWSLLLSSEVHTCTLVILRGFWFFFFLTIKLLLWSWKLQHLSDKKICSCKSFASVCFFVFVLLGLYKNGASAEKENIYCVLHLTNVGVLALLTVPGYHLLFLVLTDAVAHLPCAKIF